MPTPCVGCSIHSDQYFKSSSPALQDVICLDLQIACNDRTGLPKPAAFKRWLQGAITPFRSQAEITLRLVDEMESCALNATYRGQNQATNVLSFPFEAPLHIKLSLLGDIVICRQVVEREALAQKKLLDAHWAHLVVHGTLHLLGYDHQLEHEAQQMEQLEKQILHHLGYPDPYLIEKNETN